MSFTGGGGFGGSEEVLAYMIKAYDMATPVFRAFGGEVEATTKKIQASLLELNKSMGVADKGMRSMAATSAAAAKEMEAAYARADARGVDLAAAQAKMAREANAAADKQVAASRRVAAAADESAAAQEAAATRGVASLEKAGKYMLGVGALAAAGSLDLAVKFQANTLRMETQAGATAKGLDQIRQGLLKMAGQVGSTPDQLANGMYHIVSSMNAVLPPASRVTQELTIMKIAAEGAQIGHSNLEETTYALASAMNALHLQANSASRVMGDLNAIVGAGDMTMTDLINSFKSGIIPAAETFGISLRSIGAALAVMGDMGMRGAISGTRLRMAISLLAAPTKQAAGILETLGMSTKQALASTEKMSELLKKAGVNVTTLSNDLRKPDGLKVALEDLDNHLKSNGLSADAAGAAIDRAFGGGRMGATIKLLAENTDRLGIKFQQIGQMSSRFGEDWKLTSETFRVQLDKALASVEALGIKIGEGLLPYVTKGLHDLQDMANWLIKNKTALDLLGAAVGTFATVAIGTYLIGKVKTAINLFQDFGSMIGRFGGYLMGGPWGGGGAAPATRGALTQAQLEESLGRSAATPGPLGALGSAAMGGLWGINATQIRVGTMMNPLGVILVSGHGVGGAGAAPAAGGAGSTVAATASDKAAQAEVEAEIQKLDAVMTGPIGLNAAGRYQVPAGGYMGLPGGRIVSAGQANTLNTMAGIPAGAASAAEAKAAEQSLAKNIASEMAAQEETLFSSIAQDERAMMGQMMMGTGLSGAGATGIRVRGNMQTAEQMLAQEPGLLAGVGGIKGLASKAGEGLMRGGMVAGLGAMGAQMAGSMIGGHTGSMVSSVGSMAALGAGIGTAIEPGIGTAIGGALGGIGALITHFLSTQSFGQSEASKLGGRPVRYTQTDLQRISSDIDKMAGIVHPGVTVGGPVRTGGRGGLSFPTQEINLNINQLSPDQLAKYMALAQDAGKSLAQHVEKGWSQYKFQSEPIMFGQIKSELSGMPPALQAYGVQSAVGFAQGFEKQGRLAKGSAEMMLHQLEDAFPAFTKYLGITANAGMQEFTKALDLSHAQDKLKSQLGQVSTDFAEVQQAVTDTSGNIVTKSEAAIQVLQEIATKGSGPAKTQAIADIHTLRTTISTDLTQAAGLVDSKSQDMAASIKKGSDASLNTASQDFRNLAGVVSAAMGAGVITTSKGIQMITDALNKALKELGDSKISTAGIGVALQTGQFSSVAREALAGVTEGAIFSPHATGGMVTRPTYMVGEEGQAHPEYVLATNPAYRQRNVALWAKAGKHLGIPGFAYGGYIDPIPGFSLGRTDMGVDASAAPGTPILAFGPSRMVGYQSNWYQGQPEMVFQLTGGQDAGRFWYVAEQIVPLAHMGQKVPQGGIVARFAPHGTGIEIGWAANAAGTTLAQATSGYSEGQATAAGQNFLGLITGTPHGAGIGLNVPQIYAPKVSGGGIMSTLVGMGLAKVAAAANAKIQVLGGLANMGGVAGVPSGSWMAAANAIAKQHGWGPSQVQDWWGVEQLEDSSLSLTAKNPTSTAVGLAQFLGGPAEYAQYGGNFNTTAGQLVAMANYMAQRYGTPSGALAHERAFHWYRQGGIVPGYAGAFGSGGAVTAHGPTLAMFGDNGPETALFLPHFAGGGVTGTSYSVSSTGASSQSTTTQATSGGDVVTTTDTSSTSDKGVTTNRVTVHTRPIKPKKPKTIHYSTGFNPLTDNIEIHDTEEWQKIHAEYAKQRHDAAEEKKKYDAWLAESVSDTLRIGGGVAGSIDLTRKQALAEHLPTGGRNFALTAGNLSKLTDRGFNTVLSGLDKYLRIAPLDATLKLMHTELKQINKNTSPTSRTGQVESNIIKAALSDITSNFNAQSKQFSHQTTVASLLAGLPAGTTAKSLGLTHAQLKALGLSRGDVSALTGDAGSAAALKAQINQLSNHVLPAYQSDAKQLEAAYKASLKTHNKKLQAALLAQLDAVSQAEIQALSDKQKAEVSMVDSIYQTGQTAASNLQGTSDIFSAIQALPAGTNLAAIGLGQYAGFSQYEGGANPMQAAQVANYMLGNQRSTDINTINQLQAQLPNLKGAALDSATQHITDLSKAVLSLTDEMNTNLLNAVKAAASAFQDQADIAGGGADLIKTIGGLPAGTDLSSIGLGASTLSALGIDPALAAAAEGGSPDLSSNGIGTSAYYNAVNTYLSNERASLISEMNTDLSALPSLQGTQQTDMLKTILGLAGNIASLTDSIDKNTNAVKANTASSTNTGAFTGSVAYSYNSETFTAGSSMTSDSFLDIGVGT